VSRNEDLLTSLTKLRNVEATGERVQTEYSGVVAELQFREDLLKEREGFYSYHGMRTFLFLLIRILSSKVLPSATSNKKYCFV
jgi:hypothetical protein